MNHTVILCAILLFAVLSAAVRAEQVVWLEAEHFEDCGGWVNDSQFVDLMGSPYLLANGVGRPVADALTQVELPQAGQYGLWVRCKNWLPEHSPGQFQVLVGGRASQVTFGTAPTDKWQWVDGGSFDLQAGKVEVRLHDLTGWWGRCDAVVLAVDFRPADDPNTLADQRLKYGGVSAEVERPGPYDVVVVGGGLAGSAAAVAAARHGCKVALVQDRPVLGGNNSSEIQVHAMGDKSNEPLDPMETGIIEEFDPWPGGSVGASDRVERVVRDAGVDLHLNTRATGVLMRDKTTIDAVLALDVNTGKRMLFQAPLFIDCTGDGWVGFWAGADFRHGTEARSEFNEPLAPETASTHTMGNTLYNARFVTHDTPVEFVCPPWAYQWKSCDDFQAGGTGAVHSSDGSRPQTMDDLAKGQGRHPGPSGGYYQWWVELGGMYDTIHDAEFVRDELFRINVGLWDHVKNHCDKYRQQNANRELVWMNFVPGKRESRRLLGDYILSQRDYVEKIVHPDSVAYGGWGIDDHNPQGFWSHGALYVTAYRHKVSIPYRCLYSRNVSNLMMAGRDVSCTHVALGGIRVMRTCCVMGQAAGTAAAIAIQRKTSPRGVYEKHLTELQQTLLRDGCYIMGVKNEDPNDLARTASVLASSSAVIDDPQQLGISGGLVHDLNMDRAVMFKAKHDHVDSVGLFLRSALDKPVTVKLTLRPAKALGDFSSQQDLASATADIPPKTEGWVEFPLQAKLEVGKFYYVFLPRTNGLKWDLYSTLPPDTTRAYGGPNWKQMTGCYKHRLTPGGEPQALAFTDTSGKLTLGPENVINGWNRAVGGYPNSWMPDPKQPLPQWIELQFKQPVRFSQVHVTFQRVDMAPAAYQLEVPEENGWKPIVTVTDNALRRRVHQFDALQSDRLRLTITAGPPKSPNFAVCEMRVYP